MLHRFIVVFESPAHEVDWVEVLYMIIESPRFRNVDGSLCAVKPIHSYRVSWKNVDPYSKKVSKRPSVKVYSQLKSYKKKIDKLLLLQREGKVTEIDTF